MSPILPGIKLGIVGANISSNQVAPAQGQQVAVTVTLKNTGGQAASYSLTGKANTAGTTNFQGNFFTSKTNLTDSYKTASGTLQPGQSTTITMYSGAISYASLIGDQMDVIFTLTFGGQTVEYKTLNAIVAPKASANIEVTGINYSVV